MKIVVLRQCAITNGYLLYGKFLKRGKFLSRTQFLFNAQNQREFTYVTSEASFRVNLFKSTDPKTFRNCLLGFYFIS